MKPPEILGLLEEAAGTKMYEDKKKKAVVTLGKKQVKVDEINKVRARSGCSRPGAHAGSKGAVPCAPQLHGDEHGSSMPPASMAWKSRTTCRAPLPPTMPLPP